MIPQRNSTRPLVVLVHGLFMGRHAMLFLARSLRRAGFDVHLFAYNTVTGTLETAVNELRTSLLREHRSVALVGHSLGGLVALQAAKGLSTEQLAGVVLLGSPYQGAEAGRALRRIGRGIGVGVGRALHDWSELPEKPTIGAPVCTLSGTQSAGLGRVLCRFAEPNDGTVTVTETYYPGATTQLLPVSHTGMLFNSHVANQVTEWLLAFPDKA